jgi:hypothetical protein
LTVSATPRPTEGGPTAVSDAQLRAAEAFIEEEEGAVSRFRGWLGYLTTFLLVAMSVFHLYAAVEIVPAQVLRPVHVGFVLLLVFLLFPLGALVSLVLAACAVIALLGTPQTAILPIGLPGLHGKEPEVTRLLDTRTLYLRPKFNPDGADYCLTQPDSLRSTVRPMPACCCALKSCSGFCNDARNAPCAFASGRGRPSPASFTGAPSATAARAAPRTSTSPSATPAVIVPAAVSESVRLGVVSASSVTAPDCAPLVSAAARLAFADAGDTELEEGFFLRDLIRGGEPRFLWAPDDHYCVAGELLPAPPGFPGIAPSIEVTEFNHSSLPFCSRR